jgi:hypothetical protein
MNATLTADRDARIIGGPSPVPYTNYNRAMDLLLNEPTSLMVLGRGLAPRRLDLLVQLPVPRPRGTASSGRAGAAGVSG